MIWNVNLKLFKVKIIERGGRGKCWGFWDFCIDNGGMILFLFGVGSIL